MDAIIVIAVVTVFAIGITEICTMLADVVSHVVRKWTK